ncbi:BTAD domain-containing putative transcriptional regulator [Streptomyces sp. NPDC059909]|uniref:BTAD domain-containing putative transcriptional regulator n=1 Tax=Streptomyces sp. NPDC059909 TaxID=3346998 RepID=UPI003667A9A9
MVDDRPIELGGAKQRAALGFLLLHANQVVPTSRLLRALWSVGDAPATSRKILQNAVWGLRRALSADGHSDTAAVLLTQAPGYLVRVDPERVDLHLYQQWVKEGRAALSAGDSEAAASLLRDALGLWRGPVLADLAETGIHWPELTALQNARLDVQEDYFEAELACGRHLAVLGALESMVESEPLRERSCGQLMRALYRCGRQADALGVYGRVRAALVEGLGLEPSRELRQLQQAILTHDPSLQLPEPPAATGTASGRDRGTGGARTRGVEKADQPDRADGASGLGRASGSGGADRADQVDKGDTADGSGAPAQSTVPTPGPAPVAERRNVSVVLVRAQLGPEYHAAPAERVDKVLECVATLIRENIERSGGVVAASMGSVSLGLFEVCHDHQDGAERAVRAAAAIHGSLRLEADSGSGRGDSSSHRVEGGLLVRTTVATGEALVRRSEDGTAPPSVNGALLDVCQSLLALATPGEIQVCDETHRATGSAIAYERVSGSPSRWRMRASAATGETAGGVPPSLVREHESELDLMRGILERTRRRAMPHLITVLADSDRCRTRVLTEFQRRAMGRSPEAGQFLFWSAPPRLRRSPLALHAEILSSYCGMLEGDTAETVRDKLGEAVERAAADGESAQWLRTRLIPLVDPDDFPRHRIAEWETLEAWRQFLKRACADAPLVVVVNDVHQADDTLLDLLEPLAESTGSLPLLVIAGARPGLLQRRPAWAGGKRHAATITLNAGVPDSGVNQLLESLLAG